MKNTRKLVMSDNVLIVGRALAKPFERLNLSVPQSGESSVAVPGSKCFHGTYIPANSMFPENVAPYCSLCRPYEIVVKKNTVFTA